MRMSWGIYLAVSVFLVSLNGLWHKSLLRAGDSDPKAQAIVFLSIGGVLAILIALLRGTFHPAFPSFLLGNFLIVAIFSTLAFIFCYQAYKLIGASEIAILLATGSLWRVMGAMVFLHERPTSIQIIGAIVILIGTTIALYNKKKFPLNRGTMLVLVAAFFFALSDTSGYRILQTMDASSYQIYTQFLPVVLLLLLYPKTIKKIGYYFTKERGIKMMFLSFGDVIAMLALFFAYQAGGKASIISPLSATRVILTVLLAALFLGERENMRNKLLGAVTTVVGIMLLV